MATKIRKYDQIFNLVEFRNNFLIINFVNDDMFCMFDLDKKSVYWNLPKIQGFALTLTICPDQEKMVVAYDSNRIMVFDINNRCLHPWSRKNDELFP